MLIIVILSLTGPCLTRYAAAKRQRIHEMNDPRANERQTSGPHHSLGVQESADRTESTQFDLSTEFKSTSAVPPSLERDSREVTSRHSSDQCNLILSF